MRDIKLISKLKPTSRFVKYHLDISMGCTTTRKKLFGRIEENEMVIPISTDIFDTEQEVIEMIENHGGIEQYMKDKLRDRIEVVSGTVDPSLVKYNNITLPLQVDEDTLQKLIDRRHSYI